MNKQESNEKNNIIINYDELMKNKLKLCLVAIALNSPKNVFYKFYKEVFSMLEP